MTHSGRSWRRSLGALTVLVIVGGTVLPVAAQDYNEVQPKVDAKTAKQLEGRVATILRDTQPPSAEAKKALDDFFFYHHFMVMTSTDPVDLGMLDEKREQLFQRYINTAKSQTSRDYLNELTLRAMSSIARGGFHPAVRYNATLIIGQLDQALGTKPLPAAAEALVGLLENDKVPTAVKVATLVGLARHTKLGGMEAPLAQRITTAALAVANREEAPDDASARVYGWVRRQAAQVLANQHAAGLTPPVHQAFVAMISDDKSDLDDRCGVAALLAPTMYEKAEGLDADAMTLALGSLARKVLDIEAKEANEYIDEMLATGGIAAGGGFGRGGYGGEGRGVYGGRGGEYGGGVGRPGGYGGRGGEYGGGGFEMPIEEQGPKYQKRRMLERVAAIVKAAEAVSAGGSDELKARLGEFADAIRTVAEAAAADGALDSDITPAVANLAEDIDRMVAAWAPADQPAEEAAGDELELPAEEAPAADEERAAGGN